MGKELAEHEGVIGLGVVSWEADILIHVEGDDMFEAGTSRHRQQGDKMNDGREFSLLDQLDECLVGRDRGRTSWEAENEWPVGGGCKIVDAAEGVRVS